MMTNYDDNIRVEQKIDWLELTSHNIDEYRLLTGGLLKAGKTIKPLPRYAEAYEILPAGRVDIADNETQGQHLSLTGKDLAKIRDAEIDIYHVIVRAMGNQCLVSRIDYAIDIFADPLNPDKPRVRDINTHVENSWQFGIQHDSGYHKKDKSRGESEYFGAPKSDNRVRIYDKGAQMEYLKEAWIRVELQSRGKPATNLTRDMVRLGIGHAGNGKIRKLIQFPYLWWFNMATEDHATNLTTEPKKVPLWQKWMNSQVASSVENRLQNEDDRQFFQEWAWRLLNQSYKIDKSEVPMRKKIRQMKSKPK